MTASASPTNKRSTHHLVLTQGSTDVGLILCNRRGEAEPRAFTRNPVQQSALQIQSGRQKYADFSGVWKYVVQDDWSGGRGSKDLDKALDMYYDSYQIDTRRTGEVILGPKPTVVSFGSYAEMRNTPTASYYGQIINTLGTIGPNWYYAHKIKATRNITVLDVTIRLKKSYAYEQGSLTVGLGTVSGGNPDSIVYAANSIAISTIPTSGTDYKFVWTAGQTMTNGTDYFLVFKLTGLAYTDYIYQIFCRESTTVTSPPKDYHKYSPDGTTWHDGDFPGTGGYAPWFYFTNGGTPRNKGHFFEYKGALYHILQNDDGSSSRLYLIGDHGLAKTGATTSTITIKGKATWASNEAIGCIAVIVQGVGSNQPQNWRVITGNTATSGGETALTFNDEWDIAPAENDVIAIVASEKFTEIKEAGGKTFDDAYDVVVTDVLSVNGVVYLACGDNTAMIRMTAHNSSGTWTYHFSGVTTGQDAETGKFTFLEYSTGKIWGAKGGYPATVANANAVDYTGYSGTETVLSFGAALAVGDQYERITGLERYGEVWTGLLVVLKEGSWHRYREGQWEELDIREMSGSKDRRNGLAHCVHGNYLYVSWHNTVIRYYNNLLDSVGPDKAEVAIPTGDRFGYFSALVGVPGYVIGAVDAGMSGVSNILAYNERGWCELYRGTVGERIQNLYVQSIPGNAVDRLWISEGNNVVWLPLSIDPFNHPLDTYNGYKFCTEGTLITAWYYIDLAEIDKLFYSLRFVAEGTGAAEQIRVAYQIDDDESWTDVTGVIDSFSKELKLTTSPSVKGKRIRFKLTLSSAYGTATPRLLATVLECMPRIPSRHFSDITFRVGDKDINLLGRPDSYKTYAAKMDALDTMENNALPVYMTSVASALHGKYAWLENVRLSPEKITIDTGEEFYIGSARLVEIDS